MRAVADRDRPLLRSSWRAGGLSRPQRGEHAPSRRGRPDRATVDFVTSQAPLRHMTAQELLDYRHEPYQQELVDGILYEMEPPGAEHGFVASQIGDLLRQHVRRRVSASCSPAKSDFISRLIRTPSADPMSPLSHASGCPL